jgi:hypothetical protein
VNIRKEPGYRKKKQQEEEEEGIAAGTADHPLSHNDCQTRDAAKSYETPGTASLP